MANLSYVQHKIPYKRHMLMSHTAEESLARQHKEEASQRAVFPSLFKAPFLSVSR